MRRLRSTYGRGSRFRVLGFRVGFRGWGLARAECVPVPGTTWVLWHGSHGCGEAGWRTGRLSRSIPSSPAHPHVNGLGPEFQNFRFLRARVPKF